MNVDSHWLQEHFKKTSDDVLRFEMIFASEEIARMIQTELKRREDESK